MNPTDLANTRRALHAVAELVLAGPQYRRSGTIRLLVTPSGFRTLADPSLEIAGTGLVAGERRVPIDGGTCARLAADAGVDAGTPEGLYPGGSGVGPDEVLRVEEGAARWLEDCWAAGDGALRRLAGDATPILWPEHLDVGIVLDGTGYGVSPGDRYLPEPYAYVGPDSPRTGGFWNAPFGAARTMRELDGASADAVLAFFDQGRRRTTSGEEGAQ